VEESVAIAETIVRSKAHLFRRGPLEALLKNKGVWSITDAGKKAFSE